MRFSVWLSDVFSTDLFKNLSGHIAFMRNAHIGHGIAAYQPIGTDKAERARQHLVAARTIVGVQQDDFVGDAVVHLIGMAQANHVFGVIAAVFVAYAGLRHHEGLETLFP